MPPKCRVVVCILLAGWIAVAPSSIAWGSSHREAPLVTKIPKVDGTDFYMFRSYEQGRADTVTLIANYLPLQDPYGGPNYFTMDPDAFYSIMIDNDGDAEEDLTFRFRFQQETADIQIPVGNPGQEQMVSVPLVNIAPITPGNEPGLNVRESFRVKLVEGDRRTGTVTTITNAATGESEFRKPVDNIGNKSIPDYEAYAGQFIHDIDLPGGQTGRMFVGQRKDPFVVNLGPTFDLLNLDPVGPPDGGEDDLADKNVTSIVLELPIDFVTSDGPVIGAWTASALPRTRVDERPIFGNPFQYVQTSRLGMPLVNEVVIGLKDKDAFNASEPKDDLQFLQYVTNPTLPELIEILFEVEAPNAFPRFDLDAAFLRGFPGINENGSVGEMLRLNTQFSPVPAFNQNPLGFLGGDVAGFPNGRRPGDDVVDITLRVAMGVLLPPELAPAGQLPYTDGAFIDASMFDVEFPYLNTPLPGAP